MSFNIGIIVGGAGQPSYSVQTIEGCKIVFGNVPMSDFQGLVAMVGEDGFMDSLLANRIGATFVLGTKENLERLRQVDLPISESRQRDAYAARCMNLPEPLISWLCTGDRGKSSDAMCKALYGFPAMASTDHPHDVADFARCVEFLDAACDTSERQAALQKMHGLSDAWSRLVAHWTEIESVFHAESDDRKPKTYALLRDALGE